jgi:hypothetical protein
MNYEVKAPLPHAETLTEDRSLPDTQMQQFPSDMPMQIMYEREFYVHECYPKYYEMVVHELFQKNMRCITVTGVPGTAHLRWMIGLSALLTLGMRRDRQIHLLRILLQPLPARRRLRRLYHHYGVFHTVDNRRSRCIMQLAFKDGKQIGECEGTNSYDFMGSQSAKAGDKVTRLYDGPPSTCTYVLYVSSHGSQDGVLHKPE